MSAVAEESDFPPSCSLTRCILLKDTDALKRMLCERKKKPIPLQANDEGWTAMHIAASADEYADCLELLLRNKDTLLLDLNAETFSGETALYLACERGCVRNCTILLEGRCNPELSTADSSTSLHTATRNGHVAIVSQLLAYNLNTNCQDADGMTPLHIASSDGNLEVVQLLMANKQTRVDIPDRDHNLPLHLACRCGAFEIVKILLEADQSLIDSQNSDGSTPLIEALCWGSIDCVKYLLDHRANVVQCTNDHVTSLEHAALSSDKEKLELMLRATSLTFIREQCILGIQSILSAGSGSYKSLVGLVITSGSPECMSVLLEFGLPKSVLETPYIKFVNGSLLVYSPIAFLFGMLSVCCFDDHRRRQCIPLLLDHGITHMNEFKTMIDLTSFQSDLRYMHPFTAILKAPLSHPSRSRDLNVLIEKGITTDYCLQCDVDREIHFQNFDQSDLERFYEPVVWALNRDNADFVHLLLINSAILEPSHLWQYLRELDTYEAFVQNVVNYLMTLVGNAFEFAEAWKIIDQYNLAMHLPREAFKYLDLRKICRNVLRKELRSITIADNLKNFRRKIDTLPVPQKVKDFLHFKGK